MPSRPVDGRRRRELALRVVSALVLVPFGLFAVSAGGWTLAAGAALAAGAMAYEWSRMTRSALTVFAAPTAAALNALYPVFPQYAAGGLMAGAVLAAVLERGPEGRGAAAFGLIYTAGMALALQALRAISGADGLALALGVMLIVWASDTAAYFTGRAVGGPLIAPKDSPNKTWSGAVGAGLAAVAAGAAYGAILSAPVAAWAAWGGFISLSAQAGDMFESQIKRRYGVKDASGLVPGHGGVLDRVDGFGAACVATIAALAAYPALAAWLGASA